MVNNIIHIEDDEDDIEVFKDVVERQPASKSYLNFKSHNEALQLLLKESLVADLIVINYLMVGSNAECFVRELKQNSNFTRIHIIILSSAYDSKRVGPLLEAGASAYFQKPASYRKYAQIIEHMVKLPTGIFTEDQS